MKAELAAMIEAPDALARMDGLPAFDTPAWASSAADRALARWTLAWAGPTREGAVRAALAAARACEPLLPDDAEDTFVTRDALAAQLEVVAGWLRRPTSEHQALARASYDCTRQLHAWSDFDELPDAWILEAADFAIHAVWSGALTHHVVPPPPAGCAALAAVCAARAILLAGHTPDASALRIARAIAGSATE